MTRVRPIPPPDAPMVIAEAVGKRPEVADELLQRAVHAGTRPADLLAAALAHGVRTEMARRDRADALAAKQARLDGAA